MIVYALPKTNKTSQLYSCNSLALYKRMKIPSSTILLNLVIVYLLIVDVSTHPVVGKLGGNWEFGDLSPGVNSWEKLKEFQDKPKENYFFQGITPLAFRPLDLGEIKPSGWLLEVIRTQAAGLSGHLGLFLKIIKYTHLYLVSEHGYPLSISSSVLLLDITLSTYRIFSISF